MSADGTTHSNKTQPASDTSEFLAVLGGPAAGASSGSSGGSTQASAAGAASSAKSSAGSIPGAPVNPLVAARTGGAGAASAGQGGQAGKTGQAGQAGQYARTGTSIQAAYTGGQPTSTDLFPLGGSGNTKEIDVSFNEDGHPRRIIVIVLILLALVLVCVGAFLFLRNQVKNEVNEAIASSWSYVLAANEIIDPMTEAMETEITGGTLDEGVSEALLQSQVASNALNNASSAIELGGLDNLLMPAGQREAVDALGSAISARRDLISIARQLLVNDSGASTALTNIQAALTSINAAAQDFNNSNAASVQLAEGDESIDPWAIVTLDASALNNINEALNSVATAKAAYPDGDYTGLETYLSAAQNAFTLLVQLDTATANGDEALAAETGASYDQAIATALGAAASLPADAWDVLADSYAATTSQQASAFSKATSTMSSSDSTVTAYLTEESLSVTADSKSGNRAGNASSSSNSGNSSSGSDTAAAAA